MSAPSVYFSISNRKKVKLSKGRLKENNKEYAKRFISKRLNLNLGRQLSIVTQYFGGTAISR